MRSQTLHISQKSGSKLGRLHFWVYAKSYRGSAATAESKMVRQTRRACSMVSGNVVVILVLDGMEVCKLEVFAD